MAQDVSSRRLIVAGTRLMPVPLVPEIRLHQAGDPISLWQRTEDASGRTGLDPPFWAFAWAAGQALARYLLDHPETVEGRDVIDIASGSGLVAIAAARAGASAVTAYDIDPLATAAIEANAAVNGVTLRAVCADVLDRDDLPPPGTGLVAYDVPGQRVTEDTDVKHTTIWALAERPEKNRQPQRPRTRPGAT